MLPRPMYPMVSFSAMVRPVVQVNDAAAGGGERRPLATIYMGMPVFRKLRLSDNAGAGESWPRPHLVASPHVHLARQNKDNRKRHGLLPLPPGPLRAPRRQGPAANSAQPQKQIPRRPGALVHPVHAGRAAGLAPRRALPLACPEEIARDAQRIAAHLVRRGQSSLAAGQRPSLSRGRPRTRPSVRSRRRDGDRDRVPAGGSPPERHGRRRH